MSEGDNNGVVSLVFIILSIVVGFFFLKITWLCLVLAFLAFIISVTGIRKEHGKLPVVTLFGSILLIAFVVFLMVRSYFIIKDTREKVAKIRFINSIGLVAEEISMEIYQSKNESDRMSYIVSKTDISDYNIVNENTFEGSFDISSSISYSSYFTGGKFYVVCSLDFKNCDYYVENVKNDKYMLKGKNRINVNDLSVDNIDVVK